MLFGWQMWGGVIGDNVIIDEINGGFVGGKQKEKIDTQNKGKNDG